MWRSLTIALVAANLLFLAWSVWVAPAQSPDAAPPPVATAAAPAVRAAEPPPPPRCVSLGPFVDTDAAATVAQRLVAASLAPRTREERRQRPDGYWVIVDTASPAEQRRVLAQIRRAGVQDAYAMPEDPQTRISLGIYSERARAEQRAAGVRPLGLQPRVEEHFQEQQVQWLDVQDAGEQLSASRLESFGITDSEVGAFDCPPPPPAP
jgi:hypothetical protein